MADLVGKVTPVHIRRSLHGKTYFDVMGKFNGNLPVNKHNYPHFKDAIRTAIKGLKDGAVISCEVIAMNYHRHSITLRWVASYLGDPVDEEL